MTLCKSKADVDKISPYKKTPKYPPSYPCLVSFESRDAGICGEGHCLVYTLIPKDACIDSFIAGVNAKRHESAVF